MRAPLGEFEPLSKGLQEATRLLQRSPSRQIHSKETNRDSVTDAVDRYYHVGLPHR